jgi:hypothetical protein
MNRTLTSFGQGWWERLPAKLTPEETKALQDEKDPEARSTALRNFEERSRRPASPEDGQKAEEILRKHHRGEYTSASVVLPHDHGHVAHKDGWTRF